MRWILKYFLFSLAIFLFAASAHAQLRDFDSYTPPPPPDYSRTECWAALPTRFDSADLVPPGSGLQNNQDDAKVDVFFIHPTSYFKKKSWNAYLNDEELNKKTDNGSIKFMATVFNGSCKVYAPRYRQAALESFTRDTANGRKALALAYEDVKAAFKYYLEHYNNGRPIIIASHSQGTWHAVKLLADFFDNDPVLRKKLVAAYVIGGPARVNAYKNIPMCDSAGQIGCYMGWRTFVWGVEPRERSGFDHIMCVNPLTWKRNEEYATKELNKGGLPYDFKRIDPQVCDAQCKGEILWVNKPRVRGYYALAGNYHIEDYGLFYMNIRENVKLRVGNYLRMNPQ
jgi:hypothetical protein